MNSQEQSIPSWLRATLSTMAFVQWGLAIHWNFILERGLGPGIAALPFARPVLIGSALALTALAALVWAAPHDKTLLWTLTFLKRFRRQPASIALPVVLLALGIWLTVRSPLYQFVSLQLLLAALLLYLAGDSAWATQRGKLLGLVPILVILLGLGLRLWLLFVDVVWVDEGYYMATALGVMQGKPIAPVMDQLPGEARTYPLWGYAVGLLALPFIYATAKIWYGRRTALVTTSMAALSVMFMWSTQTRNNALPLRAASLTTYLHVATFQRRQPAWYTLVGFLSVLAVEVGPLNIYFAAAYGMAYLVDYGRQGFKEGKWLKWSPLWSFLAGAIPAMVLYAYLNIFSLPHPLRYFAAVQGNLSLKPLPDIALPLAAWRYAIGAIGLLIGWYGQLWLFSPAETILIVASTGAALFRRTQGDRHWLILFATTQLCFALVRSTAHFQFTIPTLPITLGSAGALVTYGLKQEESPGSLRERLSYAGIVLALCVSLVGTITQQRISRTFFDDQRRPILQYVRDNVPTSTGIIAPAVFFAYLPEYHTFLSPEEHTAVVGPAMAGMSIDPYWRDRLLETWPGVWVDVPNPYAPFTQVHRLYMAARHAEEVVPHLWVTTDGTLVTDADYAEADSNAALQMVAHVRLPDFEPGTTSRIDTLWVTRQPISDDYSASLSLVSSDGTISTQSEQLLVSGWSGTSSLEWAANEFHDVAFTFDTPGDLPDGTYALRLTLHPQGDMADAPPTALACGDTCAFAIDSLAIDTH